MRKSIIFSSTPFLIQRSLRNPSPRPWQRCLVLKSVVPCADGCLHVIVCKVWLTWGLDGNCFWQNGDGDP
ncbi:hypothetical protein V8C44DRAFT_346389 [Trichoderma aethiopicum]